MNLLTRPDPPRGGPAPRPAPPRLSTPTRWPALVAAAILVLMPLSGAGAPPAATREEDDLIVWVVSTDPKFDSLLGGIAIGLNNVKDTTRGMEFFQEIDSGRGEAGASFELVDLQTVLRGLLTSGGQNRQSFRIRWTDQRGNGKCFSILFKFLSPTTLVEAWKPLYQRCVSPSEADAIGCELRELEAKLKVLDDDLKNSNLRKKIVILGPNWSDAIPALWFHLAHLESACKSDSIRPPIVSGSATWSMLSRIQRLPDAVEQVRKADHWIEWAATSQSQLAKDWRGWTNALGRSLGFTDSDFDHISDPHKEQIRTALEKIMPVAAPFLPYARPDHELVETLCRQLVEVQGFRRVAILYRDAAPHVQAGGSGTARAAGLGTTRPERKVYGPALRDDFREWFERRRNWCQFLDAPYPESPPKPTDPAEQEVTVRKWRAQVEKQLAPILRFFEREGIEAIGVFGSIEEKPELLRIVRKHHRRAQLFTSDADWRLESPGPKSSTGGDDRDGTGGQGNEAGPKAGGGDPGYDLDGLLIVTSPQPTREWVQHQFRELNAVWSEPDQAFLPNTYMFYNSHIVTRLVDLVTDGKLDLLAKAVHPESAGTGRHPLRPDCLECFLRYHSERIEMERGDAELARVATGRGAPRIMLIRDGRLRPLAEPLFGLRNLVIGSVFLGLLSLFVWRRSLLQPGSRARCAVPSDSPAKRPRPLPVTPVEWLASGPWRRLASRGAGAPSGGARAQPGAGRRDAESPEDRGAPPKDPDTYPTYTTGRVDTSRVVWFSSAILVVALGLMYVDAHLLSLPVSMAFLPDGHSVLPSLLLMGTAALLAYYLPHLFLAKFNSRVRLAYRKDPPGWSLSIRRWIPPFDKALEFNKQVDQWVREVVEPGVRLTDREALVTAALAGGVVLFEFSAFGLPIPLGSLYIFYAVFNFFLWWIIIAAVWTMAEMAAAPAELEGYLQKIEQPAAGTAPAMPDQPDAPSEDREPHLGLRHLDLASVGRVGVVFIDSISTLIAILGLLVVARLPAFGMARWRWGSPEFPGGIVFAATFLVFIVAIWVRCYWTLHNLIVGIKRDRLDELEGSMSKSLRIIRQEQEAGKKQEEVNERLNEVSKEFEAQRREVEQVSEQPWEPSESRRAWITLGFALLPPVLASFLGQWDGPIMQFLRTLVGQS